MNPLSEWLSIGLFNSLISQGRWVAGMLEVRRLVRLCDSKEYREMLSDSFVGELRTVTKFGEDVQRIGREAQQILLARN